MDDKTLLTLFFFPQLGLEPVGRPSMSGPLPQNRPDKVSDAFIVAIE
jgi:hypothetical protein